MGLMEVEVRLSNGGLEALYRGVQMLGSEPPKAAACPWVPGIDYRGQ